MKKQYGLVKLQGNVLSDIKKKAPFRKKRGEVYGVTVGDGPRLLECNREKYYSGIQCSGLSQNAMDTSYENHIRTISRKAL